MKAIESVAESQLKFKLLDSQICLSYLYHHFYQQCHGHVVIENKFFSIS